MLLLIVIRSKINTFTGALFLFLFFMIAVLVVFLALNSFYKDVVGQSFDAGIFEAK